MEKKLILDKIESLRGKRAYEEKKAAKLGYNSLYDYMLEKLKKEEKELNFKKQVIENKKIIKKSKVKKRSCSCC
tara:strand:- start:13 stop:234 length:222 start_codon:yes stop_codon:yes gene_type:complete